MLLPKTMIEWYDYFQIATLILLFLLTIGRAIHLRVTQHINPITIGTGKKRLAKAVEICLVLGLALWAVVVLSFALHVDEKLFPTFVNRQLLDWQSVKLIGAALLICSLIIFILALVSFGNSWRVGIDQKTPGDLVSRGIFAVTRNPIFLSLILYASGTFLINGRLILLVFVVLIVAGVQYQIVQEENFLLSLYGEAYEQYRARTGRYIGFRRSSRGQ
jgi:protein-S-isoprenylcysteine O-methyltransferase Ste14